LASQFITLFALRNVTKQVYYTKQVSAENSLKSHSQESRKGKRFNDASFLLYASFLSYFSAKCGAFYYILTL